MAMPWSFCKTAMTARPTVGAIIPAAGKGTRTGSERPKQFLPIGGNPVLHYVLDYCASSALIDALALVTAVDLMAETKELLARGRYGKVAAVIPGGKERQDSVWNGLQWFMAHPVDYVLVHDAARPFIDDEFVGEILNAAVVYGSAVPALRPKETIKQGTEDGFVAGTPDRATLWSTQTPQIFRLSILVEAFKKAMGKGFYGTDDASLVEAMGGKVKIVPGRPDNLKITTGEDLALAEVIQNRRIRPKNAP
jgi:2-C-methyl-D-erythritol 4-phosphate cytidylyltransferase